MTPLFSVRNGAPVGFMFMTNWLWPIPECFRSQIGQRWDRKKRRWLVSEAYCFHEGCMIYDHASGYGASGTNRVRYAIQVLRSAKGALDYRWYESVDGTLTPMSDGLRGATQAEFVKMLQFGPTAPPILTCDSEG